MPSNIAQQLAQAMNRNPERPLEIALNPAELGRVRMSITPTESGIVVNILAERADTLDLMRRNIDDLGRSFTDLGYEDIAFAFGQSSDPSDTPSDPHSSDADTLVLNPDEYEHETTVHEDASALAISVEGIDLRL